MGGGYRRTHTILPSVGSMTVAKWVISFVIGWELVHSIISAGVAVASWIWEVPLSTPCSDMQA